LRLNGTISRLEESEAELTTRNKVLREKVKDLVKKLDYESRRAKILGDLKVLLLFGKKEMRQGEWEGAEGGESEGGGEGRNGEGNREGNRNLSRPGSANSQGSRNSREGEIESLSQGIRSAAKRQKKISGNGMLRKSGFGFEKRVVDAWRRETMKSACLERKQLTKKVNRMDTKIKKIEENQVVLQKKVL
jgi:hypothetical protein